MKKIISIILCVVIAFSMLSVCAFAQVKTECNGDCDTAPAIVVPGIGQSNVWALEENGDYMLDDNGNRIMCFPAVLDVNAIIPKLIVPVLSSLVMQKDAGLSDALCGAVRDAFAVNMCDENGKNDRIADMGGQNGKAFSCMEKYFCIG